MRGILIKASWVPIALWTATLVYIRPYDGWGAWAAAPLLLPSLTLSAAWAGAGAFMSAYTVWKTRRLDWPVLVATLVGGFVFAYYTVRYWLRPL